MAAKSSLTSPQVNWCHVQYCLQIRPTARGQLSGCVPWGQADNWGGEEGGSRGRGGELQCRGMAMEDIMAQASERRETMTYSRNANGDFEFAYFRGETLAGVSQLNNRFISTGHPAGQETQNLRPLIWLLCPQISRNVPDVQPLALFLCCDPRHELFSSPISRHVRTRSLMPPKAGLYQCPPHAALAVQSTGLSCPLPWHQLRGGDVLLSHAWKHLPHLLVVLETTSPFLLLLLGMGPGASLTSLGGGITDLKIPQAPHVKLHRSQRPLCRAVLPCGKYHFLEQFVFGPERGSTTQTNPGRECMCPDWAAFLWKPHTFWGKQSLLLLAALRAAAEPCQLCSQLLSVSLC